MRRGGSFWSSTVFTSQPFKIVCLNFGWKFIEENDIISTFKTLLNIKFDKSKVRKQVLPGRRGGRAAGASKSWALQRFYPRKLLQCSLVFMKSVKEIY